MDVRHAAVRRARAGTRWGSSSTPTASGSSVANGLNGDPIDVTALTGRDRGGALDPCHRHGGVVLALAGRRPRSPSWSRTTSRERFVSGARASPRARLIAAIALGVVLTYRGSGVVNFANGATAMYVAYVYTGLRARGRPVPPAAAQPAGARRGRRPLVPGGDALDLPDWPTLDLARRADAFWPALRLSLAVLRRRSGCSSTCWCSGRCATPRRWPRSSPRSGCCSSSRRSSSVRFGADARGRSSRCLRRQATGRLSAIVRSRGPAASRRLRRRRRRGALGRCSASPASGWRPGPRRRTRRAPCCSASRPTCWPASTGCSPRCSPACSGSSCAPINSLIDPTTHHPADRARPRRRARRRLLVVRRRRRSPRFAARHARAAHRLPRADAVVVPERRRRSRCPGVEHAVPLLVIVVVLFLRGDRAARPRRRRRRAAAVRADAAALGAALRRRRRWPWSPRSPGCSGLGPDVAPGARQLARSAS